MNRHAETAGVPVTNEHGVDVGLANAVRFWARWRPDATAIRFRGANTSWGALHERTNAISAGLARAGARAGDHVAVLMGNCPEFCELHVACMKLGTALVPLNVRLTSSELAYILENAAAAIVVADEQLLPRLEDIRERLVGTVIATTATDPPEWALPFSELVVDGAPDPEVPFGADQPLVIAYTSGTTGRPKGAILTHGNHQAQAMHRILADDITSAERALLIFPLAFTGGLLSFWTPAYVAGATFLMEPEFDPGRALELIERERITWFMGVPVIWQQMAAHPSFGATDLSSLRYASSGGAPVPESLLRTYGDRGVLLCQGYGITEGSGYNLGLSGHEALRKLGFTGVPLMHSKTRVVREDGSECEPNEVGELLISGPEVMAGYWNDPAGTAEALADGWLHTGDLVLVDDEGYFRIVDRGKDMFISGGLNVYPAEIERVLAGVPDVVEAAVIGVQDEKWGEVPAVVLYTAGAEFDLPGFVATCKRELADYKIPRYAILRDEPLPRGMSGKILKRELREEYVTLPETAARIR